MNGEAKTEREAHHIRGMRAIKGLRDAGLTSITLAVDGLEELVKEVESESKSLAAPDRHDSEEITVIPLSTYLSTHQDKLNDIKESLLSESTRLSHLIKYLRELLY